MVWKSTQFRDADGEDGNAALVTDSLETELAQRGIRCRIVPLAGDPIVPRVELAFESLYLAGGKNPIRASMEQSWLVVDCAFVTAANQVAFVGRLLGESRDGNLSLGLEAAAEAIAETLTAG